jgi:hypothetical protein
MEWPQGLPPGCWNLKKRAGANSRRKVGGVFDTSIAIRVGTGIINKQLGALLPHNFIMLEHHFPSHS